MPIQQRRATGARTFCQRSIKAVADKALAHAFNGGGTYPERGGNRVIGGSRRSVEQDMRTGERPGGPFTGFGQQFQGRALVVRQRHDVLLGHGCLLFFRSIRQLSPAIKNAVVYH
jgi:hypothetical protein